MQEPDIHKLKINIEIFQQLSHKIKWEKKKKRVSSFSSIAASPLESQSNVPKAIEQHTHDATVATITSESSHFSQSLAS